MIGQFVTPQKTATIPEAVASDGGNPKICPARQPNVAPTQKAGTISPPLNPARIVIAVKIIFQKKSNGRTFPYSIALTINSLPAPI